jgi:hypothetical protein
MVHHKVINDNYYSNLLLDMDLMNKDLDNLSKNLDNLLKDKDRIVVVVVVGLFEEGEEVLDLAFV